LLGWTYLQRRTRQDFFTAISYYEKAIGEEPNYALAYAALTEVYVSLTQRGFIEPVEGRRKAEEAARKTLSLDPNLAEAHVAIAELYKSFAPYNFSSSDDELRRAIELSPNLAHTYLILGSSLSQQGRLDEGLEVWMKARELDPLSPIVARLIAFSYLLKRDYSRALELLRQSNELGPAFIINGEIEIYIQGGVLDEGINELEKAKRERKDDPTLIYSSGMIAAARGKRSEALQIIKELEQMSGRSLIHAHLIARIHAMLNEKELAIAWLERGFEAGAIPIFYKDVPVWDTIRSEPRFQNLLRRMGISK
jgi:tetratricopeptide (TPR) repeat protein